jgi:hypothetical protein
VAVGIELSSLPPFPYFIRQAVSLQNFQILRTASQPDIPRITRYYCIKQIILCQPLYQAMGMLTAQEGAALAMQVKEAK